MRIAIIAAMEEEVALLRSKITNLVTKTHTGFEYYSGYLENTEVTLLRSGIGKVNAAISTTLLLERYQPDCVINTGSAGGFHLDLNVGDIVISSAVCHHDVDLTPFGYELGQIPDLPTYFLPNDELVKVAQKSVESLKDLAQRCGLIATGDRFIYQPEDVSHTQNNFTDMIACEMEAAAVAQVCHYFKVPFVIIRALSDIAGQENASTFEENLEQATTHSTQVVLGMLSYLKNMTKLALIDKKC